jgi:NAD-dependent SIR2 family protein deacetylase
MFGQPLQQGIYANPQQAISKADLLLAIGSTLIVEPANKLPGIAVLNGVPSVVMINLDSTQYDRYCRKICPRTSRDFPGESAEPIGITRRRGKRS